VTLRRLTGRADLAIELLLYHNRLQLATNDALYSDGDKYTPAVAVCRQLKSFLPGVRSVLVLGTGLGSLMQVMARKGHRPDYTLVEMEQEILHLAMEFNTTRAGQKIEPVCADACIYMAQNTRQYDLVFIDVFTGRVVPEFVFAEPFLRQCREGMAAGGRVAFNYMINDWQEWQRVQRMFSLVFPGYTTIERGENRILIS